MAGAEASFGKHLSNNHDCIVPRERSHPVIKLIEFRMGEWYAQFNLTSSPSVDDAPT